MDRFEERLSKTQWLGGQQPSNEDNDAFTAMMAGDKPTVAGHPHVFAWFNLTAKFAEPVRKTWAEAAAAKGGKGQKAAKGGKKEAKKEEPKEEPKKEEPKKVEEEADEDDLFGDDDDDDQDARMELKAKAHEAKFGKKDKPVVIAKSLVIFEVKPIESETDLDVLGARILKECVMEGLMWKTVFKKVPVAYGIFKIQIGCTIEDLKVSTDDLIEQIEAMDDMVQSVDIAAFNKL